MKKFTFTLGRMLGYKEQIADREKNTLAALRLIRDRIEDRIADLEHAFAKTSRELMAEQASGITRAELLTYDNRLKDIRERLKRLYKDLETANEDVDNQLEVVLIAVKEVSTLEKLEEHQREEYGLALKKEQENFIDEYISSEAVRRKSS